MNLIKPIKKFRLSITVLLLLIIFRGYIFRLYFEYYEVGSRTNMGVTNKEFKTAIDERIGNRVLTSDEIIDLSLKMTTETLHFSFDNVSSNPNQSFKNHEANCIGYAAMLNSIGNYIAKQQGKEHEIQFNHHVGQIYFFGINLNRIFKNPFFQDHDYNKVVLSNSNTNVCIDATVADYFIINRINR